VGYSTEKLVVQRQACTQVTEHRGQLNARNQKECVWNACVSDGRPSFHSVSLLCWYCLVTVVLIESQYGGTNWRFYFSSSWFICVCLFEVL